MKFILGQVFDYELPLKIYSLIIDLEDQGIPIKNQNQNACQFEINIEDINDNSPKLIDETQTRIFLDLQNPFKNEIILLNVTDFDSGDNGRIKYILQTDEYDSLFILYQNGSLQMTRQITQVSLFKLKILLEDYGIPSQQTIIDLIIAIGDSSIPALSTFEKGSIEIFSSEISWSYLRCHSFNNNMSIIFMYNYYLDITPKTSSTSSSSYYSTK